MGIISEIKEATVPQTKIEELSNFNKKYVDIEAYSASKIKAYESNP